MVGRAFCACVAAVGTMCALSATATAQEFPDQSRFQKVTLNDRPGEPMSLAVLPDGRVLHSARTGEIRLHDPRTGTNNVVSDMKAAPSPFRSPDGPNLEQNHLTGNCIAPSITGSTSPTLPPRICAGQGADRTTWR